MSLAGKRIIPLMDRILVRKIKPIEKTPSGIYIPEKAQEQLNQAEVLAVGPGTEENKVTLKPGDHVILPSYGGTLVKNQEKSSATSGAAAPSSDASELYLYRESEIMAKLSDI